MKKKHLNRIIPLLLLCLLSACGDSKSGSVVTGQRYYIDKDSQGENIELENTEAVQEEAATVIGTDLFMIMSNDMQSECLILEQLVSGKQYMYNYSIATKFLDKYGNRTTVYNFDPGRCVTIGDKDSQGRVLQVQISDQVWEYPEVTRYTVDEERGVLTIADTNYSFDEDLYVNSDGSIVKFEDLTAMDTLRIAGVDKKILSVTVTTGHGELQLTNTDVFEGSFIQIGDKIFSEITKDMLLEIPEGTYTVTVANNGYGGSTDVTIVKGQKQTLDLSTLEGEGPSYGNILFAVDVAGAVLRIDGKVVDYSTAIPLKYGVHSISVTADSYEEYSKRLFVNSKEATIVISLTGELEGIDSADDTKDEADTNQKTETTEEGMAGSLAGSMAGSLAGEKAGSTSDSGTSNGSTSNGSTSGDGTADSGSTSNGSTSNNVDLDALVKNLISGDTSGSSSADYLSTLTELLSSLGGSSD